MRYEAGSRTWQAGVASESRRFQGVYRYHTMERADASNSRPRAIDLIGKSCSRLKPEVPARAWFSHRDGTRRQTHDRLRETRRIERSR